MPPRPKRNEPTRQPLAVDESARFCPLEGLCLFDLLRAQWRGYAPHPQRILPCENPCTVNNPEVLLPRVLLVADAVAIH